MTDAGRNDAPVSRGQWLRQQRQARGWSVPEMRRHLREAAKEVGDTLPGNECAYRIVRNYTERSAWVTFPAGQDPAEVFQARGPAALIHALSHDIRPLARLPVDEVIDQHAHVRDSPHEALTAMRAAARAIAGLLTSEAARKVIGVTLGRELRTWTDDLHPVADPAVAEIASILPADTMIQVAATADRLSFDYSDVITELANQVTQHAQTTPQASRHELRYQADPSPDRPDALAAISFPPGPAPALAGQAPPVPPVASHGYRPRASARPEATRHR